MVQEVREIEKRERNVVVFNVPESTEEEEEERTKADWEKMKDIIIKELSCDDICPTKVVRIGKTGRHPKQMLVVFRSVEDCEQLLKKHREGPKLKNDVFVTRDRTFRQRQEAKLFREEREKEERNREGSGDPIQPLGGRGRGRGRPRGGGRGGRGGGRGRGSRAPDSNSRKRRNSDELANVTNMDEEAKRRRTGVGVGAATATTETTAAAAAATAAATRSPERVKPASDHQATPRSIPDSELGAVGGEEGNF